MVSIQGTQVNAQIDSGIVRKHNHTCSSKVMTVCSAL